MTTGLSKQDRQQISEILSRRANEITGFSDQYRSHPDHYGSVERALSREIARLRKLAERVNPPDDEEEE